MEFEIDCYRQMRIKRLLSVNRKRRVNWELCEILKYTEWSRIILLLGKLLIDEFCLPMWSF